jgi:hypothetical protein
LLIKQIKKKEQIMYLTDRLQICLLALSSRYPEHVVDINEAVLGSQSLGAEGWSSLGLIELLECTQSELLQTIAYMVIDTQKCEIYLPEYATQMPAFFIHCRGKIPCCKGNVITRQEDIQRTHVYLF